MDPVLKFRRHALIKGRSQRVVVLLSSVALLSTLGLSGCAVGPDYKKPDPWAPPHYDSHVRSGGVASETVADAPDPAWWKIFNDPELTSLEERIAHENLAVSRAASQLAQSRAQLLMAGAERFPGLSATGSYTRSQYSTKELQRIISDVGKKIGGNNGQLLRDNSGSATVPLFDQWRDSIDATYEIDLWGRVRRQYEAAKADLDAADDARRGVLIAQQAEMARDYLMLRGQQEQLRIARANSRLQQETLALARDRYKSGLVTDLDVESARSQYETTTARIASLEQDVALQMNAISLLLGTPPGSLNGELTAATRIPVVPPRVPIGVPSELAQRRPDIRQADARLHAAVANVGEAEAEFYPKITIDAGFGFQSLSFRDLGFWNARAWNVGPSISLPIFQGGKLRGQLLLNRYAQKEAAIAYRETVLTAWREVDDALIAYRDEQRRRDGLVAAQAAAERAFSLAHDQYRSGLVTYLNVLSAQNDLLQAQSQVADSTTTVAANLARLYNALGGGWQTTFPVSDPEKATAAQLARVGSVVTH
ncbi:efflux transporter outer membrane subunit [Brytella acorum]|uniref:Efflux transporter outer membrane subunit n=1 Tax=Brytella acorum TaxID=2959299 RepID=A0AA35UV88_9PROT|nr:efflux transporter outer membrane subunit [Brytella acorum]MDF3624741.1 efflux transporter outer membrane subunit [Brytella acorum]CAI9120044.1 efflux transporter outer membrane subunit [Brytella acorum]